MLFRSILVPTDGSPGAARALGQALSLRTQLREGQGIELHLVNVQRPVTGNVSSFVPAGSIEDYHKERSEKALAPARKLLQAAGLPFHEHRKVGEPGRGIAESAVAEGCDLIVMGARGLGSYTGALLGSVAASALEHATVPVLVVRG